MTRLAFALPLLLAACVKAEAPYDCNCVEVPTDAEAMAMQGFTDAALYSQGMEGLDNGQDLTWYQFDPDVATPEMIAASPAATCGYWGQTVVSSRITENYRDEDTLKEPGSKYLIVICADKPEEASQ